jgi:hypothetical protein
LEKPVSRETTEEDEEEEKDEADEGATARGDEGGAVVLVLFFAKDRIFPLAIACGKEEV